MNFVGIAAGALITDILGYALKGGYQDTVFVAMIAAVAISVFLEIKVLHPVTDDMTDSHQDTESNYGNLELLEL